MSVSCLLALTLTLLALWAVMHHYRGLTGDAELYAVQALARIHPALLSDIYLQNVNQDHFTIFSPLYAWSIEFLGLQPAALTLTLLFTFWALAATWSLSRQFCTREAAFLSVAFVIIVRGTYGASGVFSYLEDWLTARLLAEALIITALACHFGGARRMAVLIALGACFVHPLMALPGVLLLICLWLPARIASTGALTSTVGVLIGASILHSHHPMSGPLSLIDGEWLYVVKQRSQFLFLQLWDLSDWEISLRPLVCLTLTALAMDDARLRKLCYCAMLVGAAGLLVAGIASIINPVAILLQGQAWRWMWIPSFLSVALLAPTILRIWPNEKCGALCALLLLLCWTFPPIDGLAIASLALGLWLVRSKFSERSSKLLRWAAALLGFIVAAWVFSNCWTIAFSPAGESGRESLAISRIRSMMGLDISAVLAVSCIGHWIQVRRSLVLNCLLVTAFAFASIMVLAGSLKLLERDGTRSEIAEYSAWRDAIPPAATVYVMPARTSAAFAWFTLERPSYMSIDQSAGVVFSRATADEIVRRSEVLLPVQNPDWEVFNHIQTKVKGAKSAGPNEAAGTRPLTLDALRSVCSDPILDFVIAEEALKVPRIPHLKTGAHRDWNLYDCRSLRSTGFAA